MARLNGKLDVLGLDPWQPVGEGDGVQLRSGFASDDATGKRDRGRDTETILLTRKECQDSDGDCFQRKAWQLETRANGETGG